MRICVMSTIFPIISETFVMEHVTSLLNNEFDVHVLADREVDAAWESLGTYQAELKPLVWHYQRPVNKISRIRGVLRHALYHIFNGSYEYFNSWNILRFGKYSASLNLPYVYNAALLLGSVDILHCHFGPNGIVGAHLKKLGIIKKLIVTFHGYDVSLLLKDGRHNNDYRPVFEEADLILPVSEFWYQKLLEIGAPSSRMYVHRMGIDIDQFSYQERIAKDGEIRLITTARFVEKKGLAYAIKAVAHVKNMRPDINIKYDIIGDGCLWNEIQELIASLGVTEYIKLHGSLPHNRVKVLLAEADVFILPSVTATDGDQEGIPVSLMEAMACGMPVLSTWHSGIPELVEHDVSGFLVPERDFIDLAEKIICLYDHPEKWSEFGTAGRAKVEKEYNKEIQSALLIDRYKQLSH